MIVLDRLKMDAGMLDPLSTLVGESSNSGRALTSTSVSTLQHKIPGLISVRLIHIDVEFACLHMLCHSIFDTGTHSAGALLSSRGCSMSCCSICLSARSRAACSTSSASSASTLPGAALPMNGMGNAVTVSCKPLTLSQRTVRIITAFGIVSKYRGAK